MSLRESAKSFKLPSVPFSKTLKDGQVDPKAIAQTSKDMTHPAKELMGKVQYRPLRRFLREGNKSVPVLVTFDSAPQCADAERALRAGNVSVPLTIPPKFLDLSKKSAPVFKRNTHYPDRHILICPSQSFLNFNIKTRIEGEKWEFLTSVPMPLTPR